MNDQDPDVTERAPKGRALAHGAESGATATESAEFAYSGEFISAVRPTRHERQDTHPQQGETATATATATPGPATSTTEVDDEAAFERFRARDLERYLRVAPVPLVLFTFMLTALQTIRVVSLLDARDAQLWAGSAIFTCVLVVAGTWALRSAWVRAHYDAIAAPLAALVLTKLVVMPYVLTNPIAATAEHYYCAVGVFIVSVGLRLRVAAARLAVLASVVAGAAIVAFVAIKPIEWLVVVYSVLAPSIVGIFVAQQLEEKDRVAFAQERLLAHQSKELYRLAHADALSGLANRREFDRRLALEWARLAQVGRPLSLLFVDLDHFKAFNDHYGHAAGDDVITSAGAAIGAATARATDLAARYGGEEFVLLLPETDRAGAEFVASRVLDGIHRLRVPHASSPVASHLTASVGVATVIPSGRAAPSALVEEADRALYLAKSQGRNRITYAAIRAS